MSKSSRRTPAQKKLKEDKAPATPSKVKKTISPVLIKFSQGKTYAEVLEKLRKEVNATEAMVVSARATQKGDVLILLDKGSNKKNFTAEVKRVVGDLGDVRTDSKKVALEIRDLDTLATEEQVKTKVKRALQKEQIDPEVKVLNSNRRGLKLAIVVLPEKEAAKLEEISHLKVGMTSCRAQ